MNEWFAELKRIAKKQGVEFLISHRADDYQEAFSSGKTPEQALDELIGDIAGAECDDGSPGD